MAFREVSILFFLHFCTQMCYLRMTKLRLIERLDACNILADDVELQIHLGADFDLVEVRVVVGIRDDVHLEGIVLGVADGEADTINGDTTLIDSHVALLRHFTVKNILETEGITTLLIYLRHTLSGLIDMTLHDVTV